MALIVGAEGIAQAANLLEKAQLVAIPTETVYGLAADAANPDAVARVFAAKQRPADHPLIVHVADPAMAQRYAAHWPEIAARLTSAFWPGPLTLVLPKAANVLDAVTGGQATVALRAPNHPLALNLLQQLGRGLVAPSANRFSQLSPTTAAHVAHQLGDQLAAIIDGGPCQVGIESTIVDLSDAEPRILRLGMLSAAELSHVAQRAIQLPSISNTTRAPGQHKRHYQPRTPLHLLAPDAPLPSSGALLTYLDNVIAPGVSLYQLPNQPAAYAQALYALLHQVDQRGYEVLYLHVPPAQAEWAAIHDRLQRAAAG